MTFPLTAWTCLGCWTRIPRASTPPTCTCFLPSFCPEETPRPPSEQLVGAGDAEDIVCLAVATWGGSAVWLSAEALHHQYGRTRAAPPVEAPDIDYLKDSLLDCVDSTGFRRGLTIGWVPPLAQGSLHGHWVEVHRLRIARAQDESSNRIDKPSSPG